MNNNNFRRLKGMVYSMTNAIDNNVIAFIRNQYGELTRLNAYTTGGSGTGAAIVDPLASQGSIILSQGNCFLFVVNAGSNSISSFRVNPNGTLSLMDVEPSNGVFPNSLTIYGNRLYVTNVGNASLNIDANITGFYVGYDGRLTPITGSTHALSIANPKPSCVVFSPDGRQLVVSELDTNRLSVFNVNADGTLTGPTINNSSGGGPFGSAFLSSGLLLVSEAGPNALSSYWVRLNGTLNVVSASVLNGQAATCWVSVSREEKFAYTANAGSGTISIYHILENGRLYLSKIVYSTKRQIAAPLDSGFSKDGCNFYVLNGNLGSISAFSFKNDGGLIPLQVFKNTGLPEVGAQGLAVI